MIEILIHPKLKAKLVEEFDTSLQNVNMTLKFVHNSELSVRIRKRATELLQNEIKKLEKYD